MSDQKESDIGWCDYTFAPWVGLELLSRTSVENWGLPLMWDNLEDFVLKEMGISKPQRRRVFCNPTCDIFDNMVPTEWRTDLFTLIGETPHLDWLLLTKHISNAATMMRESNGFYESNPGKYSPRKNIWLGVSINTQKEANEDIPVLLKTPAKKRVALVHGDIDLTNIIVQRDDAYDPNDDCADKATYLDLLIYEGKKTKSR